MINMQSVNKLLRNLIMFSITIVMTGCGFSSKSPGQYIRYIEETDNGYRKEFVVDHWKYRVQYKPAAYIYMQESRTRPNREGYKKRKEQLKGWLFFNMYVSHDSLKSAAPLRIVSGNKDQYDQLLSYYLNTNRANFSLLIGDKRIAATVYNYENSYSLSPQDVFVLGFNVSDIAIKDGSKAILEYDDNILKTGIVRFVFDAQIIIKSIELNI